MDRQDKRNEHDIPKKIESTVVKQGKNVLAVTGTVFLSIFLIFTITLCIVAVALTVYVMQFAENSFDIDLKDVELSMSTFLYAYDEEGNEVELKQLHTDENRVWVDIDELNRHTIDAFVAVEDRRFFEHEGVDWTRTAAVTAAALASGAAEGASTITQQLVRDVTKDTKVNVGRKLREIFRALNLEQKYTKIDILESYLNRVSFGGTSYGIGSAAKHYYDKDASELTIAESALLAGLLRSPSTLNPYVNPEKSRERQEYALAWMYELGLISTLEYEEALAEKVRFRIPITGDFFGYTDSRYNEYFGIMDDSDRMEEDLYYENVSWDSIRNDTPYKWNGSYTITQSYYVDAAINQIIADFSELRGVTYDAAKEMFYKGGYKAYLNVDLKMQEQLEEKFADPYTVLSWYNEGAEKQDLLQAAFVVVDLRGNVKAVAGGLGEKEGDGAYNRATQSNRSFGSTIKPISVYSLAVDQNVITYSSMIHDIAGQISNPNDPNNPNNRQRWPQNYEGDYGSGAYYPAWYALQKSHNTIAVRTLSMMSRETAFDHLTHRLGITTLDPVADMAWSPLALGALTEGGTLVELAAAYQIFGNGGMYYSPYFYSKVVDSNGKTVLEQDFLGIQAIAPDSAWIANRMLKKVVEDPAGTGRLAQLPNVEVIGKTGTANDMSNLLFTGLTPEYSASLRIGYDQKKEIPPYGSGGWKALARAWGEVMGELVDTSTASSFVPDGTVLVLAYCTETGLLATSGCPATNIGYYRRDNRPLSCGSRHDGSYWHGDGSIPFYP
ncbi:MAG: transglycosylase domain-containing protein [Oscillospiraceae bacterium]|nr:transglycosylase domain-containing protein [Oscillospiraceae bacterium]